MRTEQPQTVVVGVVDEWVRWRPKQAVGRSGSFGELGESQSLALMPGGDQLCRGTICAAQPGVGPAEHKQSACMHPVGTIVRS